MKMKLLAPDLQAFMAIVEYKTVHKAAEFLHLTQTAVTQRLKSLEHKLKTSVFARTRRGMLLTAEGETLLRYCQQIQELEQEALTKIQGMGIDTEIKVCIAGPSSIMHARIIPACFKVMTKFANLALHFNIHDTEDRHYLLKSGQCDFAILRKEDVSLEMKYKTLDAEQYVLVGPYGWKRRKLKDILTKEKIIDFNPTDQMTFDYLKKFDLFHHVYPMRHFVNRVDSLIDLMIHGFGYSTLTKEVAQPYLDKQQLVLLNRGLVYEHRPIMAWYDHPKPPAYFSMLIDTIH